MKIDNNSVKTPGSTISGAAARPRTTPVPAPGSGATPSAQVQLSSPSSLGVDSVLANAPVTNPDKVAEIKQAIADGRFTVNAEKIASGLLDSVRQLLGKPDSSG